MKTPTTRHLTLALAVFAAGMLTGCAWSAALFATTGGILVADLISGLTHPQPILSQQWGV